MASPLMKSVSGIRGVVGETVTPRLISAVGSAFAEFCDRGAIVIGRDTRPTGLAIEKGLESALLLSGSEVVNVGVVPTPTVQVMVEHLKAGGGIVISASHNPIEWNAFKLIGKSGTFLSASEMNRFFRLMDNDFSYQRWDHVGTVRHEPGAADIHIRKILAVLNAESIRRKRFKIALDSVNGAGSSITVRLLKELGCAVTAVNCDMTGVFPRGPEPLAENLSLLSQTVVSQRADVGFAQDPDADRLAIVDEQGRPIGEENTIALVAEHLLSRRTGRVVINLSTTKAVDDIARRHGAAVARTKVGEINVVEEMRRMGARIGGEGNGGVISPEVHLGRDSLVGIGYVLEMMAERNKTISELAAELPRYYMKKGSITLSGRDIDPAVLAKLKNDHSGQKISTIDGLRIEFLSHPEFSGGWVHLRPSNTEPIFRIIAEGKDQSQAEKIYGHFEDLLK
ncbi:MAG: phosphoglucosamine mutase [Spirochaetes bacterium RBG_16_49_21]|nr:MAG: phosphoglucosamine mutase [Spirochaetes bacterium RBG_16_49_21]